MSELKAPTPKFNGNSKSTPHLTDEQKNFYSLLRIRAISSSFGQPYLDDAFFRLIPINSPGLKTMAVDDYWRVYIDFDFMMEKGMAYAAGVLSHEPWHLLRNHSARQIAANANLQRFWNYAGDLEINDGIEKIIPSVALLAGRNEYGKYKKNLIAEEYYINLKRDLKEEPDCKAHPNTQSQSKQGQPQSGQGQSGQGQSGQGQSGQGQSGQGQSGQSGQGQSGQGQSGQGQSGQGQSGQGQSGQGQSGQSGQSGQGQSGQGQSGQGQSGQGQSGQGQSGQSGQSGQGQSGQGQSGQGQSGQGQSGQGQSGQGQSGQGQSGQGQSGQGQSGQGQSGQGQSGQGQSGQGQSGQGQSGQDDSHGHSDQGEPCTCPHPISNCGSGSGGIPLDGYELGVDEAQSQDPSENDIVQMKIAEKIQSLVKSQPGSVPDFAKLWADAILTHKPIKWQQLLRGVFKRAITWKQGQVDYNRSRPSRRQPVKGVIMPALHAPRPRVLVGVDTSGSNQDNLGIALAEIVAISKQSDVKGDELKICSVDTEVKETKFHKFTSALNVKFLGGGGTRMEAFFELADKQRKNFDIFILLTDGETGWPDKAPKSLTSARFITCIMPNDGDIDSRWVKDAKDKIGSWSKVIPIVIEPETEK